MTSVQDVLRMMQSLALMLQTVTENGDLGDEIYSDIAELMGYMASIAKVLALNGGDAGC